MRRPFLQLAAVLFTCTVIFFVFLQPPSQSKLTALVQKKLHVQNSGVNLPEGCPTGLKSDKIPQLTVVILLQSAQQTVITQTIYSVLHHSDYKHLAEIVIACDKNVSDKKLEFVAKELSLLEPRVKLSRVWGSLEGKIGNLMEIGAKLSGDAVMFLDDTTVVAEKYMTPLLDALYAYPETIIVPARDELQSTLEVTNSSRDFKWTWFWDLSIRLSEAEEMEEETLTNPIETVPFSSSAFAVTKEYLIKLIEYVKEDELTTDFEIGLASWLCHGGVKIIPCSRVAQISIDHQRPIPDKTKQRIAARFFTTEYHDLFRAHVETYKYIPITHTYSQSHQCVRDMDWLMKQEVAQDVFIPQDDTLYYGLMYSSGESCFRLSPKEPIFEAQQTCVAFSSKDVIEYTASHQLKIGEQCLMFDHITMYLVLSICEESNPYQLWMYNNLKQFSINGNYCISHASDPHEGKEGRQILMAAICNPVDPRFQDWHFIQYSI